MPAPEDDLVHISDSSLKRGWINVDSTWVRLESAARLILGTDSKEKSTDRLRRVCGFSRYPSIDSQSDSILGDLCLIGQLVLALVRVNTEIALAAVRVSSIKVGSTNSRVEAISMDHLSHPDVTLTGQVLGLEHEEGVWYWNKTYILLNQKAGVGGGASTSRDTKPMLVTFQAPMVELVNPTLSEHHDDLVWSFEHQELVAAMDLLWSKSCDDLHSIPVCSKSIGLPYQSADRKHKLTHLDASQTIEATPAEKCGLCYLCGRTVPIKQYMRTHVAKHILAQQHRVEDPLLNVPLGGDPCGFCGRTRCCKTSLKINKRSTSIQSSCPFFDKFAYKPAEKPTNTGPCTNRPVVCPFPPCTKSDPVWFYRMRDHLLACHGQDVYNHVVNTGQFLVTETEIKLLQLTNMFVIPGKKPFVLPSVSPVGSERPAEDSAATDSEDPDAA
ncbi:hypothetical protein FRC08_013687 [Ceratobasidium sp. 394]|nr:hypothetical protein FRC08_013687 [Ceratobasidium sp. 394]